MPVQKKISHASTIAVGVFAAIALSGIVALAWHGHVLDSRNPYGGHNSYGMRDYTINDEEKAARSIVAGLNTRNPDKVDLLRFHGHPENDADNKAINDNIERVLPAAGCQYVLDRVADKGELDHPAALVPWYSNIVGHAWGFDISLRQLCPGRAPTPRTIRVVAIAGDHLGMGGFWAEAALYDERASRL